MSKRSVTQRVFSKLLAIVLLFALAPPPVFAADAAFPDVPPPYWAYTSIVNTLHRGVVNGYPDGSFRPADAITNAQFAAVLARAFYAEACHALEDSFGAWYGPCAAVLFQRDIMRGTGLDADFHGQANRPLLFFDMAQMVYNVLLDQKSAPPAEDAISSANRSADLFGDVPDGFQTAVNIFCSLDLLGGHYSAPSDEEPSVSRAQACAAVEALSQYITSSKEQAGGNVKAVLSLDDASATSVKIILTNCGEKEFSYTRLPVVECYRSGDWSVYPSAQETNTDIAILRTVQPGQSQEYVLNLSYYYGELPSGFYLFRVTAEQDGIPFSLTANVSISSQT